jgi:tetratricopeptide (TPR) repeat protein
MIMNVRSKTFLALIFFGAIFGAVSFPSVLFGVQTSYDEILYLLDSNDFEGALKMTNQLLESHPESIKAQAFKAHVLALSQDFEGAKRQSNKVFNMQPNPVTNEEKDAVVMAHQALSNVFVREGDLDASFEEIEKALRIKPDSEIMLWQLAVGYAKTGKNPEAREKANRLIEIGDGGESRGIMAGYAKQLLAKLDMDSNQKS